ncbi:hypothetical protein LINGRAHAP2_LOCUS14319 [Linum grandiflorum]
MEKMQRGWVWRWCSRHYESNYNTYVKDPNMKERLKSIVNEGCRRRFNAKVADFLEADQRLGIKRPEWVLADQLLWSKVVDAEAGGFRYGIMTTNMAESINGAFKGIRSLPICALVRSTFYRLTANFEKRRNKVIADRRNGEVWTDYCRKIMADRGVACATYDVRPFDHTAGE